MVEQIIIRIICATALAAGLIGGCTGCVPAVIIKDVNAKAYTERTDNLTGFIQYKRSLAPEFQPDTLEACVCSSEEYAQADGQ